MKRLWFFWLCLLALLAVPASAQVAFKSTPILNRYIVVFKPTVGNGQSTTQQLMAGRTGTLHYTYDGHVKGFAATLPPASLRGLQNNPNILWIEQDHRIQRRVIQAPVTWGLDRIDQPTLPLSSSYEYIFTGAGVTAFIIDTGIRADHIEFTGRILPGYGTTENGGQTTDCNGHGTHVAGTVGGTTYGVAKGVSLVPVRVLDCYGSGTWSGVIAGINWVAAHTARPAVANMSLGGGFSSSVNLAVSKAVGAGVTMVVAAGNDGADACTFSPASEPTAITVGATGATDARPTWSNYGSCVDLFAPGENIRSAAYSSTTGSTTMSGTSMATPHVTGVAALVLQSQPTRTPAQVAQLLRSTAQPNAVLGVGAGSPNYLLQTTGLGGVPAEPPPVVVTYAAVGKLTSQTARKGSKFWTATVTVQVVNPETAAIVPNATVNAVFVDGTTAGSATCLTGNTGECQLSAKGNVGMYNLWTTPAVELKMFSVTAAGFKYDPSKNVVNQLVIKKP